VHEYTRRVNEGEPSPFPFSPARADHESINWKTSMAETMILGLRLVRDGVDREDFAARFGSHPEEVYGPQIADLKRLGLLEEWGNSLRLTPRAYLISNRVFVRFMPEADE
jgi:oxygen-independent coproporphyrinogen-3 oxidase